MFPAGLLSLLAQLGVNQQTLAQPGMRRILGTIARETEIGKGPASREGDSRPPQLGISSLPSDDQGA